MGMERVRKAGKWDSLATDDDTTADAKPDSARHDPRASPSAFWGTTACPHHGTHATAHYQPDSGPFSLADAANPLSDAGTHPASTYSRLNVSAHSASDNCGARTEIVGGRPARADCCAKPSAHAGTHTESDTSSSHHSNAHAIAYVWLAQAR